jgi:DNA-binding NtrC family response regulator
MMAELPILLLVDDDTLISDTLAFGLRDSFVVHTAATRDEAKRLMYGMTMLPKIALVDLGLPPNPHSPEEGFTLVKELLGFNTSMRILVLSGQDSQENINHAYTLGAVDFVAKPCELHALKLRLQQQLEIINRKDIPVKPKNCDFLIGQSMAMEALRLQIKQFADSPFSILVQGESGTGKELVAQCLHIQSQRSQHPCLTVNCAAFTSELLEAQLFGHTKGAFTGAVVAKAGFFEEAGEGSLILDEIGEMPMTLQSKLLRVLENGEYYRIGETKVRKSNARIIAETNRDLRQEVEKGNFRKDLYHRLSVLSIKMPNVAERDTDKLLLLSHFQNFYADMGALFELDAEAKRAWEQYDFPGNVRELRNIIIRLGAKYPNKIVTKIQLENELEVETFSDKNHSLDSDAAIAQQLNSGDFSLDDMLLEWERRYINVALEISHGNLSQAARFLGINRTTLYSKTQRLSKEL